MKSEILGGDEDSNSILQKTAELGPLNFESFLSILHQESKMRATPIPYCDILSLACRVAKGELGKLEAQETYLELVKGAHSAPTPFQEDARSQGVP